MSAYIVTSKKANASVEAYLKAEKAITGKLEFALRDAISHSFVHRGREGANAHALKLAKRGKLCVDVLRVFISLINNEAGETVISSKDLTVSAKKDAAKTIAAWDSKTWLAFARKAISLNKVEADKRIAADFDAVINITKRFVDAEGQRKAEYKNSELVTSLLEAIDPIVAKAIETKENAKAEKANSDRAKAEAIAASR